MFCCHIPKKLQFSKVYIFSDNQGACQIILVGNRKSTYNNWLWIVWIISRIQFRYQNAVNIKERKPNCFVDFDNWQINQSTFLLLTVKWGPLLSIALLHITITNGVILIPDMLLAQVPKQ